jgi:hypothetical protein
MCPVLTRLLRMVNQSSKLLRVPCWDDPAQLPSHAVRAVRARLPRRGHAHKWAARLRAYSFRARRGELLLLPVAAGHRP